MSELIWCDKCKGYLPLKKNDYKCPNCKKILRKPGLIKYSGAKKWVK